MDELRSCYTTTMRFFSDSDIETRIIWYFAPPGAKHFPGPHRFGARQWEDGKTQTGHLGEVRRGHGTYYDGRRPPLVDGQRFCGNVEQYRSGTLYATWDHGPQRDQNGTPDCCKQRPGGWFYTGTFGTEQSYGSVGGFEFNGTVHPLLTRVYYADGGIELGGTSPAVYPPYVPLVFPHLAIYGEGTKPLERQIIPEGGCEFGGDGSKPFTSSVEAQGGVEVNGDGSKPLETPIRPEGGIEVDGTDEVPTARLRMTGGVEIGGAALPTGGVLIGACGVPIARTLYLDPPFFVGAGSFDCWTLNLSTLPLVYSDVTGEWSGAGAFGTCGRAWAVTIKWLGPGPLDWSFRIKWTPGPEIFDPGPALGMFCSPFVLGSNVYMVYSPDIGAGPDGGDAFFSLGITDNPPP